MPFPLLQTLLTADMAQCVGVIGVDSGLSHIAVALDLPHVQIYNFDTAWRTGPVGLTRQCALVDCPTPTVDAVWQAWQRCVASPHVAPSTRWAGQDANHGLPLGGTP